MEQQIKPRITFTFPIRWLNEDREFLGENLVRSVKRAQSSAPVHPRLMMSPVQGYWVILRCHAYNPQKIKLTQQQLEKYLKPMYPYGHCMLLEHKFVQEDSPTLLPVMELQILY